MSAGVRVTQTFASGVTTQGYQYWGQADSTIGNAAVFTIYSVVEVGGWPFPDEEIGEGVLFTRIFLGCPGDPHAEAFIEFD